MATDRQPARCRRCRRRSAQLETYADGSRWRHCARCGARWSVRRRGGPRTGAGAPPGNLNALRHGRHSRQLRHIVLALARKGGSAALQHWAAVLDDGSLSDDELQSLLDRLRKAFPEPVRVDNS